MIRFPRYFLLSAVLLAAVALWITGCSAGRTGAGQMPARIYGHYKGPMFFSPGPGGTAVSPDLKVGRATAQGVQIPGTRGVASAGWGDFTLNQAMADGGIERVHFADYELFTVLGVYTKVTLTAYGE